MTPKIMRGVLLCGHGGLEQLQYRDDLPVPAPAPGEVLIQIGAAGINNTDINLRTGWYSKATTSKEQDASWTGTESRSRVFKVQMPAGASSPWERVSNPPALANGCLSIR